MYTPNVASDRFITAESPQTVNHVVTFNGSAFVIDGTAQPALTFRRGDTHVFDVSADSMIDNRLRFSETIDGSEEYIGRVDERNHFRETERHSHARGEPRRRRAYYVNLTPLARYGDRPERYTSPARR